MTEGSVKVRLLFVDDGSYRNETILLPGGVLEGYDRLIDGLREAPEILARVYVDVDRLCAAHVVDGDEGEEEPDGG
jgi:hypothetical protein